MTKQIKTVRFGSFVDAPRRSCTGCLVQIFHGARNGGGQGKLSVLESLGNGASFEDGIPLIFNLPSRYHSIRKPSPLGGSSMVAGRGLQLQPLVSAALQPAQHAR